MLNAIGIFENCNHAVLICLCIGAAILGEPWKILAIFSFGLTAFLLITWLVAPKKAPISTSSAIQDDRAPRARRRAANEG